MKNTKVSNLPSKVEWPYPFKVRPHQLPSLGEDILAYLIP
jgi:hypothetical protein